MDKSLFISMNGADNAMHQLEVITNNLANVNTNGFRSDSTFMHKYEIANQSQQTRAYAQLDKTYTNFEPGSIIPTGRELDIAMDGQGFIAVQSKTGKEGYTRTGGLQITQDGTLMTSSGHFVIGNAGIVNLPPSKKISIAPDGTISALLPGTVDMVMVDQIKLVNPNVSQLKKGEDTLFYLQDNSAAAQDPNAKIVSGALEGSNVNVIDTMTRLIDLSRHYEIHTNFMKTISDNTEKANQLLSL